MELRLSHKSALFRAMVQMMNVFLVTVVLLLTNPLLQLFRQMEPRKGWECPDCRIGPRLGVS